MKKYSYSVILASIAFIIVISLLLYPLVQSLTRLTIELRHQKGDPQLIEPLYLTGGMVNPYLSTSNTNQFAYALSFQNGEIYYKDMQLPMETNHYYIAQLENTRALFPVWARPNIARMSQKITVQDRYELWTRVVWSNRGEQYHIEYVIVDREEKTVKTGVTKQTQWDSSRLGETLFQVHGDLVTVVVTNELDRVLTMYQISLTTGELLAEKTEAFLDEFQHEGLFDASDQASLKLVHQTSVSAYSLTNQAYSVISVGEDSDAYYSLNGVEQVIDKTYVVDFSTLRATPVQLVPEVLAYREQVKAIHFYVAETNVYYLVDRSTHDARTGHLELWQYDVETQRSEKLMEYAQPVTIMLQHGRYLVALNDQEAYTNDLRVVDLATGALYQGEFVATERFYLQPEGVDYGNTIKYE